MDGALGSKHSYVVEPSRRPFRSIEYVGGFSSGRHPGDGTRGGYGKPLPSAASPGF